MVLLDLWVDDMLLLFLHYQRNSMLPILWALYITTSRKTQVPLYPHLPQKVYIIIHNIFSSRLCSSNNKHNSNKQVVLRGRRRTLLIRAGGITQIIRWVGRLAVTLQVATAIPPPGLYVVIALVIAQSLNSPMALWIQTLPT